jgi:DNA-binding GntR family transcriptional regulator
MDTAPGSVENGELFLRKSLKEGVFDYLHQRIVAGMYPPGEWLRQEEIALQLGVSQTPVREALDLLVSVGLAERVPYKGVRVPELTHAEIADAYVLRLVLESAAARLAAQYISPEQLHSLSSVVERMKRLVTLEAMSSHRQLNKQFHLMVVEASGNPLMSKLYEMVSNLFPDWRLYEYMFRHPELLEASLSRELCEHQAIVDALAERNADLCERRVVEHIRNIGAELEEFLGIPGDYLRQKEGQLGAML